MGLLTLNSPESLNALSSDFLDEILAAIKDLPALKVLIITGVGKGFVAGANIKEMSELTPDEAVLFSQKGQAVFQAIEDLPYPVIAAVNGFALGGGCELALACDFIIASEKAKFGQPEVGLGIIPGFGGTQRLARAVGLPRAKQLIYTGEIIRAEEALAMGLVNQLVAPEDLIGRAKEVAAKIMKNSCHAVSQAKAAMMSQAGQAGYADEANRFGKSFAHPDQKEGMKAFLEKRTAKFGGK